MSVKQTKILIICLLAGLLLCSSGCVSLTRSLDLKDDPYGPPARGMTITMDVDQREGFFTQIRKFADKHALEIAANFYDADKSSFLMELIGDGFHIAIAASANNPREITIGFFNDASTPTPQATVNELIDDLKSFINEIPNVMITELRKRLRITMNEGQRDQLFTQMRKLANEHSLKFELSFSSDKTLYLVEIHGDGFHITSDARSNPPGEYVIAFFLDYDGVPKPSSLATVDKLSNELKRLLGEIPNVTITEE